MSLLFWLFLAHFLADFPLQTNWVYRLKCTSIAGGLVHALGVFIPLFLVLSPYLSSEEAWLALSIIVMGHFIQDTAQEPWHPKKNRSFAGYLFDQLGHLWWSFLVWIAYLVPLQSEALVSGIWYQNPWIPLFFLGLIVVTYVWETTVFLWQKKSRTVFVRNYGAMTGRGFIFSVIFIFLSFL